jgi:hypothetical protein
VGGGREGRKGAIYIYIVLRLYHVTQTGVELVDMLPGLLREGGGEMCGGEKGGGGSVEQSEEDDMGDEFGDDRVQPEA